MERAEDEQHKKEIEAVMFMNVRLVGENQQWERRYSRLEADYQASFAKVTELSAKLERRSHALEACRKLLAEKQGIEDSGEIDV